MGAPSPILSGAGNLQTDRSLACSIQARARTEKEARTAVPRALRSCPARRDWRGRGGRSPPNIGMPAPALPELRLPPPLPQLLAGGGGAAVNEQPPCAPRGGRWRRLLLLLQRSSADPPGRGGPEAGHRARPAEAAAATAAWPRRGAPAWAVAAERRGGDEPGRPWARPSPNAARSATRPWHRWRPKSGERRALPRKGRGGEGSGCGKRVGGVPPPKGRRQRRRLGAAGGRKKAARKKAARKSRRGRSCGKGEGAAHAKAGAGN